MSNVLISKQASRTFCIFFEILQVFSKFDAFKLKFQTRASLNLNIEEKLAVFCEMPTQGSDCDLFLYRYPFFETN